MTATALNRLSSTVENWIADLTEVWESTYADGPQPVGHRPESEVEDYLDSEDTERYQLLKAMRRYVERRERRLKSAAKRRRERRAQQRTNTGLWNPFAS